MSLKELCQHYKVASVGQLPPAAFIMPEFYPRNSLMWTAERLDYLTLEERRKLCEELREVYLKEGKQAYAEHLTRRVRATGSKEQQQKTLGEKAPLPKSMNARLERIQNMRNGNEHKQTILGMAEQRP